MCFIVGVDLRSTMGRLIYSFSYISSCDWQGHRVPAAPKRRKTWSKPENDKLHADWVEAKAFTLDWKLSKTDGTEKLDKRSRALGGDPSWFRTDLNVYTKPSELKLHDWMQLLLWGGEYVFHDLYPDHPGRMEALYSFITVIRRLNIIISIPDIDEDDDEDPGLEELKVDVINALALCEREFPDTELSVLFHVIVHMPNCIHRWGSVRNFWCFWTERCVAFDS